jgi:UPF0755 protein
MRRFFAIVFLFLLAFALYVAYCIFVPYGSDEQRTADIRPGDSSRAVAAKLQSAGAIRSELAFLVYHYALGARGGRNALKAGEYAFDHPETIVEVHRHLTHGDIYARTVVVPEGFNMFDIAHAIEAAGIGRASDFLNEAQSDTALIADLSPDAKSLEGYLFPDTYRFSRHSSMRDIASSMVKRFRQEAASIGLLQREPQLPAIVTMASFVEKESAVPEERPIIAGVFYNRLKAGIPLATDPSVIYASLLAGTWKGTIHQSELHSDSLYNTYSHAGLTPGPICNPGASALKAAMNPAATDYLYFVADGSGTGHHRFARNLEEHNHNVALYRAGR